MTTSTVNESAVEAKAFDLEALFDAGIGFGIEIECCYDNEHEECVRDDIEEMDWKIKWDSSIEADSDYDCESEIVSPILYGQDGIEQIRKVFAILAKYEAYQNITCGTHFHFDYRHLLKIADTPFLQTAEKIMFAQNVVFTTKLLQGYIDHNMPECRADEYYCQSFSEYDLRVWDNKNIDRNISNMQLTPDKMSIVNAYYYFKYKTFNLKNLIYRDLKNPLIPDSIPTIEFRQLGNRLEFHETIKWLKLSMGILRKCADTNYDAQLVYFDPAKRVGVTRIRSDRNVIKFLLN